MTATAATAAKIASIATWGWDTIDSALGSMSGCRVPARSMNVRVPQGQEFDRAQLESAGLASARSGDGRYPLTVR